MTTEEYNLILKDKTGLQALYTLKQKIIKIE